MAKKNRWTHTSLKKIQAFRESNGFSESATAKALGVAVGSLRNWTKKGRVASPHIQKRVAAVLAGKKLAAPSAAGPATETPAPFYWDETGKKRALLAANGHVSAAVELLEIAVTRDDMSFVKAALALLNGS